MIEFHQVKQDILNKIDQKRVAARLEVLGAFVDELLTDIPDLPDGVFLNVALLTSMVRSYFIDVERYKDFHVLEFVESYKVASYSAKWILKYKPIQFKIDDPSIVNNPVLSQLNELFALQWGFAVCDLDVEKILDDQFAEILYTLHYRHVSEDNLTLVFKALGATDVMASG